LAGARPCHLHFHRAHPGFLGLVGRRQRRLLRGKRSALARTAESE
jgi:hypothetical protein